MATHIKKVVDEFLAKKKEEYKQQERIQQIVSRFLDSEAQEGIEIKGIFRKEIVFKSASSSHSYSFRLKKEKILAGVREEFPWIKDIRIEIG